MPALTRTVDYALLKCPNKGVIIKEGDKMLRLKNLAALSILSGAAGMTLGLAYHAAQTSSSLAAPLICLGVSNIMVFVVLLVEGILNAPKE